MIIPAVGVRYSVYCLDGEHWDKYEKPVEFTTDGDFKIFFLSHDNVGNEEKIKIVEFSIDKTSPKVTATPERPADYNGWFNHPIKIVFSDSDPNGSGIKSCDSKTYTGPDGINAILAGTCTDNAGNLGSATFNFKYDSTAPKPTITTNPTSLWPPNGRLVDVTINGSSGEPYINSLKFSVEDEYKKVEPVLVKFGDIIKLEAKRDGGDKDGRTYIIKVTAEDLAGNKSQSQVEVIVPHN